MCAHVHVYRNTHTTSHLWRSETNILRVRSLLPPCFEAKSVSFVSAIEFYFYTVLLSPSFLSASGISTHNADAHRCIYLVMWVPEMWWEAYQVGCHKRCSMASSMMLRSLAYCIQHLLGTWVLVSGFHWAQLGEHSCWSNLAMVGGWSRLALTGTLDYLSLLPAPNSSPARACRHNQGKECKHF